MGKAKEPEREIKRVRKEKAEQLHLVGKGSTPL